MLVCKALFGSIGIAIRNIEIILDRVVKASKTSYIAVLIKILL